MKYIGIPLGMWVLFEKLFRKNLVSELGYNKLTAKQISKNAKSRYKSIIRNLPEFEKGDRFKTLSAVQCSRHLYSLCPKDRALTNLPNTIQKR